MAADVWAFGQIAYQLLACPDEESILQCSEDKIRSKVVED